MIITIDGPAGSGKSTAARKAAGRLQIAYLDTGSMYRAVAHKCLQSHADLSDSAEVLEVARQAHIELDCGPTHSRVILDGIDVSEAIRSMETNRATPAVSKIPGVRQLLVEQQRRIGTELGSLISEGRDQGSVVFPHADVKFVLDASLEKRAERRYHEMCADGIEITCQQIIENLRLRDSSDQRQWAPLLKPGKAITIDTTHLTIDEVVEVLLNHVEAVSRPRV